MQTATASLPMLCPARFPLWQGFSNNACPGICQFACPAERASHQVEQKLQAVSTDN
jgi:hypothetical protein